MRRLFQLIIFYFSNNRKRANLLKKKYLLSQEILKDNRFETNWKDRYLIFNEATISTDFDAHYLYHTAWAARILAKKLPNIHIDISSDVRFVTLVSAFIPIKFYDYRPVNFNLSNLSSEFGDLMSLPFETNTIESISCMHVIEHIGLERYGDPLDGKGDIKAINELIRVLKFGGNLYFVTPVGSVAKIQYNAHRIYTYKMVLSMFKELKLENFSLITDDGKFINDANEMLANNQKYGCGCFLFTK